MITPSAAPSSSSFYAFGNTPAVNLTRDLPQGVDANILLLGCGDIRNILHTAYANAGLPTRAYDVVCCDVEEGIIARNIVLLSFIIDGKKVAHNDLLWNLSLHVYLSDSDSEALYVQVEKLLYFSETLTEWKNSKYGAFMPMCDEATLEDIRVIWNKYLAMSGSASKTATVSATKKSLELSRAIRTHLSEPGSGHTAEVAIAMRSTAPLDALTPDNPGVYQHFWATGVTGHQSASIPNPLVAACLSDHKLLAYGTDPNLAFNLAPAYTPLAATSPLRRDDEHGEKFRGIATSKIQFSAWIRETSELFSKKKLHVRFCIADALAFCHTVQHFAESGAETAAWYKRQFDARPLRLDYDSGLPTSFDAIDTSSLTDTCGGLNLLISALPLLAPHAAATLATETLHDNILNVSHLHSDSAHLLCGHAPSNRLLCGHGPSVALLLGLSLVDYWTNTTSQNLHNVILTSMALKNEAYCESISRLSWKHDVHFTGSRSTLDLTPEQLARILSQMYRKMLQHESTTIVILATLNGPDFNQEATSTPYTHFHRGSFVNLLKFVQRRFPSVDFDQVCAALHGMITADDTLFVSESHSQQLSAQLHIQGIQFPDWLRSRLCPNPSMGGFHAWKSTPEVAAVTLVVPRKHLNRMYGNSIGSRIAVPCFIGSVVTSKGPSVFSDVQLTFGTVSPAGSSDSDDFALVLKQDQAGWSSCSPLIASFYVPTSALQVEPTATSVALDVLVTAQSIKEFCPTLGSEMRVFEAALGDESQVFVTKFMPGHQTYPVYSAAAKPVKALEESGDTSMSKASFTADVDSSGKITTTIGHLDVLSEEGKSLLKNKVPIELQQSSPFIIDVVFGKAALVLPLHFPHAVDSNLAKLRIARKSGYVEVLVPFADPLTTPALFDFIFPTVLAPIRGRELPVTLNAAHLALDTLPILDIENKSGLDWLPAVYETQFSAREIRLREGLTQIENGVSKESPRIKFKGTVHDMALCGAGLLGGKTYNVFSLYHEDPLGRGYPVGVQVLFFLSAIRLDVAAGSVVLDAAVLPLTTDIIMSGKLRYCIFNAWQRGICGLRVDDAELVLWKKILPALVERARTWSHKETCEYAATKKIPLSTVPHEQCICSCGQGVLPENFCNVPGWATAAPYATRVAINPSCSVPLVEDIMEISNVPGPVARCANCGATGAEDGGALKKCKRCLETMYCGPECQKQDWARHRKDCREEK